ncbi:MAG: hypothetical protein HC881_17685 [Leptolyngbyaceae cyanobacterium SL_7_1]|nr:hypothetical protein [Leptolyngbyaceae cyanobacterium SL_7_1]
MDVLCLLATAALTKADQRDVSSKSLWLVPEPMTQLTPVYELERQSINESFTVGQEQWSAVEDLEPLPDPNSELNSGVDSHQDEMPQFSPTVSLEGKVILAISGIAGEDLDDAVVVSRKHRTHP